MDKIIAELFNGVDRAKQAAWDAHRAAYPYRLLHGHIMRWRTGDSAESFTFLVIDGLKLTPIFNWWSVNRSDFKATEITAPADWPSD
jgi:hypothetical protein